MAAKILIGDVRAKLAELPDNSVHVVCTSPPYWGLRAYGTEPQVWGGDNPECAHEWGDPVRTPWANEMPGPSPNVGKNGPVRDRLKFTGPFCTRCNAWKGELGSEPDPWQFIANLVEVFRSVRRVLHPTGILLINIGDSYAGSGKGPTGHSGIGDQGRRQGFTDPGVKKLSGIKPKDLVGIPWMLAFALRDDGWWWRGDYVWSKRNPMPESVLDRCTRSHEAVLHFAKRPTYYWDAEAIREPATGHGGEHPYGKRGAVPRDEHPARIGRNDQGRSVNRQEYAGRNKRSVWEINTRGFADAHFATFPPELVEVCVKAGTSERGVCPRCLAPWRRVVERSGGTIGKSWHNHQNDLARGHRGGDEGNVAAAAWRKGDYRVETTGWQPGCAHYDSRYRDEFPKARSARKRQQRERSGDWWRRVRRRPGLDSWPTERATVLDPFAGSFTTCLVAKGLRRHSVGIDLNPEYVAMGRRRLASPWEEDARPAPAKNGPIDLGPLFAETSP